MAVLVAPRLRARFEAMSGRASLEDWCALAEDIERAASAAAADEAIPALREIEALRTEVAAKIARLRGDVTREIGPGPRSRR